jgi:hypothetical protein
MKKVVMFCAALCLIATMANAQLFEIKSTAASKTQKAEGRGQLFEITAAPTLKPLQGGEFFEVKSIQGLFLKVESILGLRLRAIYVVSSDSTILEETLKNEEVEITEIGQKSLLVSLLVKEGVISMRERSERGFLVYEIVKTRKYIQQLDIQFGSDREKEKRGVKFFGEGSPEYQKIFDEVWVYLEKVERGEVEKE